MALENDLRRIAEAAARFAADGEEVAGIVPAEPANGIRVYVCAYGRDEATSWLVFDATAVAVQDLQLVRDAVSIAALCELADELAGREPTPRVATPAYLDAVGTPDLASAFGSVEALTQEVERAYKAVLR